MTRSAVLTQYPTARIHRIRIGILFVLANAIRTHRHLAPIALVVRRTLALHAQIVVRTDSTVLAEIATRVRLTLFAPITLIAFAHRQHKPNRALAIAIAVAVANARFATLAREPAGTLALTRSGCGVQFAHTVVFTFKSVAVLALASVVAGRTVTSVHVVSGYCARGTVVTTILCNYCVIKTATYVCLFGRFSLTLQYDIGYSHRSPVHCALQRHRNGGCVNVVTPCSSSVASTWHMPLFLQ